jgi:hypothetical protein
MATVYGVNADKILVDNPSQKAGNGEVGGRIRCIYDEYALTADLAAADVIKMGGLIPAGARIMDVVVAFTDLDASGGTLDIGWQASDEGGEAADVDGFLANVDVATAADVVKMTDNLAFGAGQFKKFSEPVQAIVTVDGDTDATSGTVALAIYYILD